MDWNDPKILSKILPQCGDILRFTNYKYKNDPYWVKIAVIQDIHAFQYASYKLRNNANFIFENDDINNIEWLNGTTPISVSDIQAKIAELPTAEEEATAKANNKTSAQNKLKALGLTDAEIEAL